MMKQKIQLKLAVAFLFFGMIAPLQSQAQLPLDCAKLDMTILMQLCNDGFALQLTEGFCNLKRLEDCIKKDVYTEKESIELIDRQLTHIQTSNGLLGLFFDSGVVTQLNIENYQKEVSVAIGGLREYAKSLKTYAKEKNEAALKNVTALHKKSWELIALVTHVAAEEK